MQPLYELFTDPEVLQYWSRLRFTSLDEARALVERITARYQEGTGIEWGVCWKAGGPLIGKCGFHRWHKPHFRAELGYSVVRRHWGEGVMREALPAVLRYGFEQMELHSVEAQIDPGNIRSIKTVQRLGFVQEGHLRENFVVGGRFTDTLIFSLLKTPTS